LNRAVAPPVGASGGSAWLARRPAVQPEWLTPLFGLLVAVLVLGIVTIEQSEIAGANPRLRNLLVVIIVAAWVGEFVARPRLRLLPFAVVTLAASALIALGWDLFTPVLLIATVGWFTYTSTEREGMAVLALAVASLVPPFFIRRDNQADWINWVIGLGFSWVAMWALLAQQRTLAELRAAQAEIARQPAAAERRRIARELHDVIAHSLAITMLHLTGARHILARDPQRAAEALVQAEQTGRQSMADIRRTVGLLAEQGEAHPQPVAAPLPDARDIPNLVADYARAGIAVTLTLSGDAEAVPPAIGLDLYRLVQEALANAAKHAPGARVAVALDIAERLITLRVEDSGPVPGNIATIAAPGTTGGSGLGLVGMRERVARLGGEFAAGPSGTGLLVECRIPFGTAESTR
jgi:signal transduction histidine kinase